MTPTIPVAEMPWAKHLKVSFFLPPGILLKNGNCYVEIKKKQTVTVGVIAQCTNKKNEATKFDKVIIPQIRNVHSGFWRLHMYLPAVLVRPFFVILTETF